MDDAKLKDSMNNSLIENADNLVFILSSENCFKMVDQALRSEIGMRKKDGTWRELPDVYCWFNGELNRFWTK